MRPIVVVGTEGSLGLGGSYARAFRELGRQVRFFDLEQEVRDHARFRELGRRFAEYVPVEAWARKANRRFFIFVEELHPSMVVVPGTAPIRVGALAQMKVRHPDTQLVLLWPDPLTTLERHTLESLPIWDLVATYSRDSIPVLRRLGAQHVAWFPFAFDEDLHGVPAPRPDDGREFACDAIFVGNYRPERERAVLDLLDAGVDVKVYGSVLWRRGAAHPERVSRYYQGRMLMGREFAIACKAAKVSLNLLDPGNYPAANMRFFEAMGAEACTVNTPCPEVAETFVDGDATVYADYGRPLVEAVQKLLATPSLCDRLRSRGAELVKEGHTYVHRARKLSTMLEASEEAQ